MSANPTPTNNTNLPMEDQPTVNKKGSIAIKVLSDKIVNCWKCYNWYHQRCGNKC